MNTTINLDGDTTPTSLTINRQEILHDISENSFSYFKDLSIAELMALQDTVQNILDNIKYKIDIETSHQALELLTELGFGKS